MGSMTRRFLVGIGMMLTVVLGRSRNAKNLTAVSMRFYEEVQRQAESRKNEQVDERPHEAPA